MASGSMCAGGNCTGHGLFGDKPNGWQGPILLFQFREKMFDLTSPTGGNKDRISGAGELNFIQVSQVKQHVVALQNLAPRMKPADAANVSAPILIEYLEHCLLALGSVHRTRIERDIAAEIELLHITRKFFRRDKLFPVI